MSAGNPIANMRPAGAILPRKLGDVMIDEMFQYEYTFTLGALENQVRNIPIQADAHFYTVSTYYNSSAASGSGWQGSGVNLGGALIQLTDGGTTRALSNAQVPINTLFGSAQRPFIWPLRKIFKANTSITINITDTTNAAQVVYVVFGGFKIPLGTTGGLLP